MSALLPALRPMLSGARQRLFPFSAARQGRQFFYGLIEAESPWRLIRRKSF